MIYKLYVFLGRLRRNVKGFHDFSDTTKNSPFCMTKLVFIILARNSHDRRVDSDIVRRQIFRSSYRHSFSFPKMDS